MFTSLFREEAVASRNQRQQLDRLLRITAPHERVVLAGIGLVVLAFLGWALFGSVEREVRADGILIETHPVRVVLRVAPDRAQRIRPGMPASVEVGMPDGAIRSLSAEVAAVTSGPLPDWLAALAPAHDDSGHRVDVALSEPPGFPIPEGTPCRVHIVVGRHPPIALFGHGRS